MHTDDIQQIGKHVFPTKHQVHPMSKFFLVHLESALEAAVESAAGFRRASTVLRGHGGEVTDGDRRGSTGTGTDLLGRSGGSSSS